MAEIIPLRRGGLAGLYRKSWVVYSKPPFGSPEQVLAYLARYTHRVALFNSRWVRLEGDQVTFTYKDYAQGARVREMTLLADEFIRRFLKPHLGFFHRLIALPLAKSEGECALVRTCGIMAETKSLWKKLHAAAKLTQETFSSADSRCGGPLALAAVVPRPSPAD